MKLRKWKHLPKVVQEELKDQYMTILSMESQANRLFDKIEDLKCPYPLHKMEKLSGEKTQCSICELKAYAKETKMLQTDTEKS